MRIFYVFTVFASFKFKGSNKVSNFVTLDPHLSVFGQLSLLVVYRLEQGDLFQQGIGYNVFLLEADLMIYYNSLLSCASLGKSWSSEAASYNLWEV